MAYTRRDRLEEAPVDGVPLRQRLARVVRQLCRLAREYDVDAVEPALEMRRDLERVAAVVARPGEDQHAAAAFPGEFARELRRGESRALHEVRVRVALQRRHLERADAGSEVEGGKRCGHGRPKCNRATSAHPR
jgi:hypothetical protein